MTTILDLINWIGEFRKNRRAIPHGSPLWAYKLRDSELSELQRLMSDLVKGNSIHKVIRLYEGYYSEAFVLFAATWLQRNSFGRAKWDPLLLAVSAVDMKHIDRTNLVDRGLRRWGLNVYSTETSSRYLDSLTCQGGFPRSDLLLQSESHIMEYFEEVLTQYERYQYSESLDELAIECLSHLPITLQQNAFAVLVTQLVECLLDWKAHYDLGLYADAVKVLDNENHNWRQELPFLVIDEEAKTLINKLLKRASTFKRREQNPIRVKRQLVPVSDGYRLVAEIYIAKEINPADLARQLGGQSLPCFFLLSTQTCDGNRFRTASFTLRSGASREWQTSSYYTAIKNSIAAGELSFSIDSDGRQIITSTYYRGEALEPNTPWVFEPSGSALKYIGQGSIKSNKGRLIIVSGVEPLKSNISATVVDLGALIESELRVYEVTGEVKVDAVSGSYCVNCNSGESEVFKVAVETPEYIELAAKHPVYRGIPVVTYSKEGETKTIPESELYWYNSNSKTIVPLSLGVSIGAGVLVWGKDQTLLWEKACIILPESFEYHLKHIEGTRLSLVLRNANQPIIGMLPGYENWIDQAPNYEANELCLGLLPKDAAAEYVGISLKWSYESGRECECELKLPIAFNVATLISRKGQPYHELERGGLTLNELPNLQVVVRTDRDVSSISVVVNLFGPLRKDSNESLLMTDQEQFEVNCVDGKSTIRGIDLSGLASKLFNHVDELDSYLRFVFYAGGIEVPNTLPKVTRYKHDPKFVDDRTAVILKPTPLLVAVESPVLYLSPIWDFDRDPIELEPDDKGANVWRFSLPDPKRVEYGGWLIWADSELSVHPRIKNYAVPRVEQDPSTFGAIGAQLLSALREETDKTNIYKETLRPGTLAYNVKYLNPKDYSTLRILNKSIRNLGFDIYHPGWRYIDGVMKRIESLEPLALFAMTSMQRNPAALAVLLFRDKDKFNEAWDVANRLGMSWYIIAPKIWISVLKQYYEKFKKSAEPLLEISEETYWDFVYRPFAPLEAKGPYFKYLVDLATERLSFEPVAIWENEELAANGFENQTVGAFFRRERTALIARHEGKLMSRIGTKSTTEYFLKELDQFWPTGELPQALGVFIKYTEAGRSAHHTKQNAWTLTMAVPMKLGFCISSYYRMPSKRKRQSVLLGHAISRVDEFDREWLQNALIIAHMACDLLELEKSIGNLSNHPESIA